MFRLALRQNEKYFGVYSIVLIRLRANLTAARGRIRFMLKRKDGTQ